MDVKKIHTTTHQCSASNMECVEFLRHFPGTRGDFPYVDILEDQCCICYFSGEECDER